MRIRHPDLPATSVGEVDPQSFEDVWKDLGWKPAEKPHPLDVEQPVRDSDPPISTIKPARTRANVKE